VRLIASGVGSMADDPPDRLLTSCHSAQGVGAAHFVDGRVPPPPCFLGVFPMPGHRYAWWSGRLAPQRAAGHDCRDPLSTSPPALERGDYGLA